MKTIASVVAVSAAVLAAPAFAGVGHFEGFEDSGWTQGGDNWNNFGGTIQRVVSGTNGIASSDGAAHAHVSTGGAFTRFGGYSSSFSGGYIASLDIYLDTSWGEGTGFDFSTAASRQTGDHLRDFIWHVGVDNGELTVNASNNTDFGFNSFKLQNENMGSNTTIASSGWYTFETVFSDDGGSLSVDYNLIDDMGNTIYSVTRSNAGDDIATTVGGNRYGWFTYNTVGDLAIDNTSLSAIPMPTPLGMAGVGLMGVAGVRRRR